MVGFKVGKANGLFDKREMGVKDPNVHACGCVYVCAGVCGVRARIYAGDCVRACVRSFVITYG